MEFLKNVAKEYGSQILPSAIAFNSKRHCGCLNKISQRYHTCRMETWMNNGDHKRWEASKLGSFNQK